jgi:hypothetical protein
MFLYEAEWREHGYGLWASLTQEPHPWQGELDPWQNLDFWIRDQYVLFIYFEDWDTCNVFVLVNLVI